MSNRKRIAVALPEEAQQSADSAGKLLRQARERAGISIEAVATQLRVRAPYLIAIEADDISALPGTAYALGFVRSYARFLELDADALVERFRREVDAPKNPNPQLYIPRLEGEGQSPGPWVLVIAAVLLGGAYMVWASLQQPADERDRVPPPPLVEQTAPEAAEDAAEPATAEAVAERPLLPDPDAVTAPALEADGPAAVTLPPTIVQTRPLLTGEDAVAADTPVLESDPADPPPAADPGAEAEDAARVALVAEAETWVEIRAADGTVVFSRILNPEERYAVPDRAGLTMVVGNPAGLSVVVDGVTSGPLGPGDRPMRGISLDPAALTDRFLAEPETRQPERVEE